MIISLQIMKAYSAVLCFALVATTQSGAIPKDEHDKRVVDKDLSDQEHFEGADHNSQYDHEAFLGKDEAKTFDQLTPEESKERLSKIVDKIDKDNDGYITEDEMKNWIKYVQKRYIYQDTDRQWAEHEPKDGSALSIEEYRKKTYGFLESDSADDDSKKQYDNMLKRDEKRWKKADENGDGKLSKEEFANFLHPEEAEHMKDIVVEETMEDIDKNHDGFLSLEEYIGDMWSNKDNEEEPDWVKNERDNFASYRDKNKDGKMDISEVREWILPADYDHTLAEAKHLMQESDTDKDDKLTKEEILEKYDLFVGSQATDFGEALMKHDEF